MSASFSPPFLAPGDLTLALRDNGHAVVDTDGVCELIQRPLAELNSLVPSWDDLPPDGYLRDGGRYRRRRHGCYIVEDSRVDAVPHRAHWQPLEYNALHGGLERWFEPITPSVAAHPAWRDLLARLAQVCSELKGAQRWFVEAHQFRIDTTDGIGRPTPEGAHRDGVDFVVVVMVGRSGVKGGETRVFEAAGPRGIRFTMESPWTLLMLDDARVIHETTPIQPTLAEQAGYRDTLVLTFRREGFQGPAAYSA